MSVSTSGGCSIAFLRACLAIFIFANQGILRQTPLNVALASEITQVHDSLDPNKPSIIVHVGPPKTGTTALQVMFKHLKEDGIFAKDNYHYDRKKLFGNTIMGHSCHQQLMELRQSFKTADNEYTISEIDLANQLRNVPCWGNALEKLEPYLLNRINLFSSFEAWGFEENVISTENGRSMLDWESVRLTLTPDWNFLVVFTYRRYPEWIFSSFQQMNKPTRNNQHLYIWPNLGGRETFFSGSKATPLDPLPMSEVDMLPIWYRYSYDLKQEMDRNPAIPYAIFNMHEKRMMLSSFVCNMIPNSYHSCKHIRAVEKKQKRPDLYNRSQSLFYDALAVAAYEAGLIKRTYKRLDVADAIRDYHNHELNHNPTDFPLICPPEFQLNQFLQLSLVLEKEIVPEFANLPGVKEEHIASYWKQVTDKKFCWIDTETVLKDSTWIDFFKTFQR